MKCQVPSCKAKASITLNLDRCEKRICCSHHTEILGYNPKDFHLIHTTRDIEAVLESGYLKSVKESGVPIEDTWLGESMSEDYDVSEFTETYLKSVFTGLLFPGCVDGKIVPLYGPRMLRYGPILFFKSDLVKESEHWCPHYNFGIYTDNECIRYDKSLSLKENLNSWRDAFSEELKTYWNGVYGYAQKEVVFTHSIPLKNNLLFILVGDKADYERLRVKYPEYTWVNSLD